VRTDFRSSDPNDAWAIFGIFGIFVVIFVGIFGINKRNAIDDSSKRIRRLSGNHDIAIAQCREFFQEILQLLDEISKSHYATTLFTRRRLGWRAEAVTSKPLPVRREAMPLIV